MEEVSNENENPLSLRAGIWWRIVLAVLLSFGFTCYVAVATREHPVPAPANASPPLSKAGFTLIEMSIVLVIIGLIVGGVLVGQDLIRAAYVRAQISQIEKFNTVVNTFYGKYQALPGDMNATVAQEYGFAARGSSGQGDGNGIIEGNDGQGSGHNFGFLESQGETVMFWGDMTYANGMNLNLIQGSFITPNPSTYWTSNPDLLFPKAVLGTNSIYVYSVNGINYYGISKFVSVGGTGYMITDPGLTVQQAYRIDQKVDDGLPQSGRVTAQYDSDDTGYTGRIVWASGGSRVGGGAIGTLGYDPGGAGFGTPITCYDNGGNASNPTLYSLAQNNGNGLNCALSFRMQGGD